MKLLIVTVGKPKLSYAEAGVAEYLGRLKHYGSVEWKTVKNGLREDEGERLLAASEKCLRVVLDEKGKELDSREWAALFSDWEMQAMKTVAFLIGGADGHGEAVKKAADLKISLGRMTLQHELALVVLLEQLYRAQTIRRGEPYHRD